MTARQLHRMNLALDEALERLARKAISEGKIKRKDGEVFYEGAKLDLYQEIFHRLLNEEEEAERWERLQEKL